MGRTRGTYNTRGMWLAGGVLAAVLALTGYAVFSGDDGDGGSAPAGSGGASASASPGPGATYAPPEDWTEPNSWAALPRGERTDEHGSSVGFPKSTEGAVAMMAAANTSVIEGETSTVDEQLRVFRSYASAAEQSAENVEQVEHQAQDTDKDFAQQMGVRPGEPLPAGAYVRSTVIGFKVIKASDTEVSAWVLARVVQKNGETKKEAGSYTRTLVAVQWQDGDWKLTGAATRRVLRDVKAKSRPAIVAPGDREFNKAGWTAIREAS